MADWTNISDTAVDPDAPVTSELAYAWRDNPIAIAEGATNSPVVSAGWNAYNSTAYGDGTTGRIWDFATNGAVSSVTTPDLLNGYDYKIILDGVRCSAVPSILFEFYHSIGASWSSAFTIPNWGSTALTVTAFSEVSLPMRPLGMHFIDGIYFTSGAAGGITPSEILGGVRHPSNEGVLRIRMSTSSGNFNLGNISLLRRRVGP